MTLHLDVSLDQQSFNQSMFTVDYASGVWSTMPTGELLDTPLVAADYYRAAPLGGAIASDAATLADPTGLSFFTELTHSLLGQH